MLSSVQFSPQVGFTARKPKSGGLEDFDTEGQRRLTLKELKGRSPEYLEKDLNDCNSLLRIKCNKELARYLSPDFKNLEADLKRCKDPKQRKIIEILLYNSEKLQNQLLKLRVGG